MDHSSTLNPAEKLFAAVGETSLPVKWEANPADPSCLMNRPVAVLVIAMVVAVADEREA